MLQIIKIVSKVMIKIQLNEVSAATPIAIAIINLLSIIKKGCKQEIELPLCFFKPQKNDFYEKLQS
jgi:hypothetical protein